MNNIFNYDLIDLENILINNNYKKYNAKQIMSWIYDKKIYDFYKMTNISKELINYLNQNFNLFNIKLEKIEKSKDTNKYLFKLKDGHFIESVLMKHDYGNSVCISSQVGCNMGCAFCESGRLKKQRDLLPYEMVEQIILIQNSIKKRIDSVVIMGIGEPFDNYDNVMKFIKIINNPHLLAIGARHITVSTCGLVPMIEKFSNENLQVNLAVSLHAPNNEIRNKIMKINKVYDINKLISALKKYISKTNRRVTIEYILLDKINDSEKCAIELANLLKEMNVYVNLIPYNETSHLNYKKTKKVQSDRFYDILKKNKINVTIRKEFGSEITAACGQLRASEVEK